MRRRLVLLCSSLLLLISPVGAERAKNIILMIGDGLAPDAFGVVMYYSRYVKGRELSMVRLMNEGTSGYMMTSARDFLITCSAASGTAIATGEKTNNGMVSMLPDGQELTTILHKAEDLGKATGLVTTARITHATPAAFAVSIRDRNMEDSIASMMLNSDIEVMLGGAKDTFPQI